MKRVWQLLKVLLLQRWGILLLLALFYAMALLLMIGQDPAQPRTFGIALLLAFPTAGVLGLATERVVAVCSNAGELGIPRHAASVVGAQVTILVATIGIPLAAGGLYGHDLVTLAAVLCVAAAIGAIFSMKPWVIGVVIAGAFFIRGHEEWIAKPSIAGLLVAMAMWALYVWSRLPWKVEANGASQVTAFAGTDHEATDVDMAAALDIPTDSLGRYEHDLTDLVEAHKYEPARGLSLSSFAVALGFDALPHVRPTAFSIAAAVVALLANHFLKLMQETPCYLLVVFFCGAAIVGGASIVFEVWRRTRAEQGLLVLMPRWPADAAIKRLFVAAVAWKLPGAWAVFCAASVTALVLHSVSWTTAMNAGVALLAASVAAAAELWLVLASRSLRKWRWSTLVVGVSAVAGGVSFAVGLGGNAGRWMSVLFLLAIPAAAYAALAIRPLQFPANVTYADG